MATMLVIMDASASVEDVQVAREALAELCREVHVSVGVDRTVIGLVGDEQGIDPDHVRALVDKAERVVPVQQKYRLAALEPRGERSTVRIGDVEFGPGRAGVIAGPCAIETYDLAAEAIWAVKEAGATVVRGDAWKARTSPYDFQGYGEKALRIQARIKEETGLPFIVDVLTVGQIEMAISYGADCLRVGTRYMYDAELLRACGRQQQAAVMIKRGFTATLEEWLLAAEYVLCEGNGNVILCERGVRTFAAETRNTLDLSVVSVLHGMTHLPVIVDPSHSVGRRDAVADMARAAIAAGADGLMIDVHPRPKQALVDGAQALRPDEFAELMRDIYRIADVLGTKI